MHERNVTTQKIQRKNIPSWRWEGQKKKIAAQLLSGERRLWKSALMFLSVCLTFAERRPRICRRMGRDSRGSALITSDSFSFSFRKLWDIQHFITDKQDISWVRLTSLLVFNIIYICVCVICIKKDKIMFANDMSTRRHKNGRWKMSQERGKNRKSFLVRKGLKRLLFCLSGKEWLHQSSHWVPRLRGYLFVRF